MSEKYENPLEVHKKSDDSYHETASNIEMSASRCEICDDDCKLERHRFRKDNCKSRWPAVLVFLIVLAVIIPVGIKYSNISSKNVKEKTTNNGEVTTDLSRFKDTITVKGNDIFFEGKHLEHGLSDLMDYVKYLDTNSLIIQDEHSDSNFLIDIEELLMSFNISYEIQVVQSSGLEKETTTVTTKVMEEVKEKSNSDETE